VVLRPPAGAQEALAEEKISVRLIKEQQSPAAANELVACEHLSQRDFGCVWHHHPEIEIFFLLRGGTERWIGDKITPLKVGEVLLLGSDLPHDFRNDRKGRQAGVEWILVQFRPNLFGEDWTQHSSVAAVRRLLERARLGLEFRGATRRQAAAILHKMPKAHGLRRLALLIELLELAAGSDELKEIASTGFHATTDAQTSDRIGNVVAHIKANLAKPLYVPELAGLAGLSESAFSRLFKKCTGRSVPQYLNELRIARAARLLAETDESVKQIAHHCGYPTAAYFHRQFQRHQELPPLAYREAIRRHS
jgi:AraC-like DNA-binding protein/mannose-6-phosphate isomerase-like protein (cupin superfamily)